MHDAPVRIVYEDESRDISPDDLAIIHNALNEALTMDEDDLETRVGATHKEIETLLEKTASLLDAIDPPLDDDNDF